MSRNLLLAGALVALLLTTAGCSAPKEANPSATTSAPSANSETAEPAHPPEPVALDLSGEWSWSAPGRTATEDALTATITGDRIEVRWPVSMTQEMSSEPMIYWAGTFVPPEPGEVTYSFTSTADPSVTGILLSQDPTKQFDYADEALSFDITIQEQTVRVDLRRAG